MTIRSNRAAAAWALVAALGCVAVPARAQYGHMLNPGMSFKSPVAALADFNVHQMMQRSPQTKLLLSRLEKGGSPAPLSMPVEPAASASTDAPRHPLSATDFRPAGPRRVAEVMVRAVADPAERAKALAGLRDQQAAIEAMPGFRRNNLACALTMLVGMSVQVLTGRDIDEAQSGVLLQALNDALVATDSVARLDPRRRTEAYDTMLVVAVLIGGMARGAADTGDATQAEQARALARETLAAFGLLV